MHSEDHNLRSKGCITLNGPLELACKQANTSCKGSISLFLQIIHIIRLFNLQCSLFWIELKESSHTCIHEVIGIYWNYQGLFENGIRPNGSYLDVFGYVPPDEDFNPQHPATRTAAMHHRISVYNWVRANLGIVGTEAACDWTVPYVDFSSPLNARNGIPIPLWDLVYHEAILTTYNYADLRGVLYAGLPQLGRGFEMNKENLEMVRRMSELNKRLAFIELVKHEFLDSNYQKERTLFADGTTITVDWEKKTVEVVPE